MDGLELPDDSGGVIQIEIPELKATPDLWQEQDSQAMRSGGPNEDTKPASVYALHILFTHFVRITEPKLNIFGYAQNPKHLDIDAVLGPGADPEFDNLLMALGHVARRKPKPVVDSVMYWRKSKSEALKNQAHSGQDLQQLEIRNLVSVYILCRALMAIVQQAPNGVLGAELGEKLEDVVFAQLLAADPALISANRLSWANWNQMSKLLGEMSRFRFASVDDRFISALEKVPSVPKRFQAQKAELLIRSMRYLQIRLYPENHLDEAANFLESLAKFYADTQDMMLKDCYALVLAQMLQPVADAVTVEVNHPTWSSASQKLFTSACEAMKRSFDASFELAAMALCVSEKSNFAENWLSLIEVNASRHKGKYSPRVVLIYIAAARLIWVLIFRCTESLNSTTRNIEAVRKCLLVQNKRFWQSFSDVAINACVSLVRSCFHGYQQHTIDNIFFPLLVGVDATAITNHASVQWDNLINERAMIVVKAFTYIITDMHQNGFRQPFPSTELLTNPQKPTLCVPKAKSSGSDALQLSLDMFCTCLNQIFLLLDQKINDPTEHIGSRQNSMTQFVNIAHKITTDNKEELFVTIIESIPFWIADHMKSLEVLCQNISCRHLQVSTAATAAILQIARSGDIRVLFNVFCKYLFSVDLGVITTYDYVPGIDLDNTLKVYIEIIENWVSRLHRNDAGFKETSQDMYLSALWAIVEEMEGNGLFFLCSYDSKIRARAMRILWLTSEMDRAIEAFADIKSQSPPIRVLDLLEQTEIAQIAALPGPIEFCLPERSRVSKFKNKKNAIIARLASSDYGVDSGIWLKLFPKIIKLCFEKYPMPVAICRSIVCQRLVQMHDVVTLVGSNNNYQTPLNTKQFNRNHDAIVEQWRIYLMVACATITSTDEQKLYVPSEADQQLSHSRKKSTQKITLHHQRITSSRSVFRIVTPLLSVANQALRDAIISGLSCINVNTYKTLLECLLPVLQKRLSEFTHNLSTANNTNNVVNVRTPRIISDIVGILKATASYLANKGIVEDKWIRDELPQVVEKLSEALALPSVQLDYSLNNLRCLFCGLLTVIYRTLGPYVFNVATRRNFWSLLEGWTAYGRHAVQIIEREEAYRRFALVNAKDARERSLMLTTMDTEKREFEKVTCEVISEFLSVPLPIDDAELNLLLKWLYSIVSSNKKALENAGQNALFNILLHNSSRSPIISEVVQRCYHNSDERYRNIGKLYLSSLVRVLREHPEITFAHIQQLLALALFKLGDSDRSSRELAIELISLVETRLYGDTTFKNYQYRLRSSAAPVYKQEIFLLSTQLAKSRPQETYYLFSQLTKAFHDVNDSDRRDILSVLLPWIQNIEFSTTSSLTPDAAIVLVLLNLLEITVVFADRIQHEVEVMWVALCSNKHGTNNATVILNFLIDLCLAHRSTGVLIMARTILIYLASSPAGPTITERLLQYLEPRFMISQNSSNINTAPAKELYPFVTNIDDLVALAAKAAKSDELADGSLKCLPPLSYGQIATLFLVDVLNSKDMVASYLPVLLHVAAMLSDHFVPVLQDKARNLLLNLVGLYDASDLHDVSQYFSCLFGPGSLRWTYDDASSSIVRTDGPMSSPENMVKLVKETVNLVSRGAPDIQRSWAAVAVRWATSCPVRHIAVRSFQVFRCLFIEIDQKMLADMLARLSTTISEFSPDIQGFAIQILMTLNAITDQLDNENLLNFPQLFWATVASLGTINEQEYIEAMSILLKILEKWDFASFDAVEALRLSFPSRWEDNFGTLLPLILLGLRSANASEITFKVLDELLVLPFNDLFGDQHFVPLVLMAYLARLLHAMEAKDIDSVAKSTQRLCDFCLKYSEQALTESPAAPPPAAFSLAALTRMLQSFIKGRILSKQDFLHQYVMAVCSAYPKSLSTVLTMLMGTLLNKDMWAKAETLEILRLLLPQIDPKKEPLLAIRGADIVSPLLRLLHTSLVEQALDVLDEASGLVAGKFDEHILRMSLGSRPLKEYENTATLYGIPEDSGWSVPMPAVTATATRRHVHAVFYTCAASDVDREISFEFEGEDEFEDNEYRKLLKRMDSLTISGAPGSLDTMVSVLDDLDSFFTQVVHPQNSLARHRQMPSNASACGFPDGIETQVERKVERKDSISIPQLYDKKVSVILQQCLNRNPSSVSFLKSFADTFGPTYRSDAANSLDTFSGPDFSLSPDSTHSSGEASLELQESPKKDSSFRLEGLLKRRR